VKLSGDRNRCSPLTGGCGEYFNSTTAFDKHRSQGKGKDRACSTVDEMTAKGMAKNAAGYWCTALKADNLEHHTRRAK